MEVSKRVEMLKQFLRENDALEQYIKNTRNNFEKNLHITGMSGEQILNVECGHAHAHQVFSLAFVFAETPEGLHFWHNLREKWTNKFKKVE